MTLDEGKRSSFARIARILKVFSVKSVSTRVCVKKKEIVKNRKEQIVDEQRKEQEGCSSFTNHPLSRRATLHGGRIKEKHIKENNKYRERKRESKKEHVSRARN